MGSSAAASFMAKDSSTWQRVVAFAGVKVD
jgi:hypothetical protein